jgi:hypothetical protein
LGAHGREMEWGSKLKNISINKIKKHENTHPCDKTDLVPSLQFLSNNLNKYL